MSRRAPGLLLAAGLLAGCGSAATASPVFTCHPVLVAPTSGSKSVSGAASKDVFFAQWQRADAKPNLVVEAFSLTDGRSLGEVSAIPDSSAYLAGPHRSSDGALWYTITSGPCGRSSGLAGGDPAPNSCGGIVARVDPVTQKSKIVLQAPASDSIGEAVPSPDGTRIAYLSGGCDTSFFNQHLIVRDLETGTEFSIGAEAKPCHAMSPASWSPDGSRLLFTYAPSRLPESSTFVPHGTCQDTLPGELAVVRSDGAKAIGDATIAPARPGCRYATAAFDHAGIAAIETCGQVAAGPTAFLQFDAQLVERARLDLPPAADGTSLVPDSSGEMVLVDEYQSPEYDENPSRVKHGAFDWIEVYDGRSLRLVTRKAAETSQIRGAIF